MTKLAQYYRDDKKKDSADLDMNRLYKVSSLGVYLMTAPLFVITRIFGLREEAIDRLRDEAQGDGVCSLYFNGRRNSLLADVIEVREDGAATK